MPVVELLERLDSRELTEWGQFFQLKNDEADLRADGLTEDEIADVIEQGTADRYQLDRDEPRLLDALIGDEAAAERARRRFDAETAAIDDEEDED